MPLRTDLRLADPDEVYASLLALFEGLEPEVALRAASRLVLLLANHIGDTSVVLQAIDEAARTAVRRTPPG